MNSNLGRKVLRKFFPLIALAFLAPWPVAYAYDFTGTADIHNEPIVSIAVESERPTWTRFDNAIGGVTPGELFSVDVSDQPDDIQVTLYLTNTRELSSDYRYMILEIGVYGLTESGSWERIPEETFLTLLNGQSAFTLPGLAEYKISICGGSFYSLPAGGKDAAYEPKFYLEVN